MFECFQVSTHPFDSQASCAAEAVDVASRGRGDDRSFDECWHFSLRGASHRDICVHGPEVYVLVGEPPESYGLAEAGHGPRYLRRR